jgi:hypothetical protein
VGVVIDGYNLYWGARRMCGKGAPGWRWLDLKAMSAELVAAHSGTLLFRREA